HQPRSLSSAASDVYKRQDEVLEKIVSAIPAPQGDADAPLQALIIDSWFDTVSYTHLRAHETDRRSRMPASA
ncbi:hypothetical protein, partial [Vibrio cholerae]|uniref:hypothetical protein n=1 Tax=Vibrio cholerae TaxID=666 RepID=UPI003D7CDE48